MSELVVGEVLEAGSLEDNERIVKQGLRDFVQVGQALARIRDDRQFMLVGFDTFEDYIAGRLGLGASWASQQIGAARVADVVHARELPPPASEFHARPLVKVLNERGDDAVAEAWSQIVNRHEGDTPITGREVLRFLRVGGGANYGKAGWHELLGEVGDTLTKAGKQLAKVEGELTRKPSAEFADRAEVFASRAAALAERLRGLKEGPA